MNPTQSYWYEPTANGRFNVFQVNMQFIGQIDAGSPLCPQVGKVQYAANAAPVAGMGGRDQMRQHRLAELRDDGIWPADGRGMLPGVAGSTQVSPGQQQFVQAPTLCYVAVTDEKLKNKLIAGKRVLNTMLSSHDDRIALVSFPKGQGGFGEEGARKEMEKVFGKSRGGGRVFQLVTPNNPDFVGAKGVIGKKDDPVFKNYWHFRIAGKTAKTMDLKNAVMITLPSGVMVLMTDLVKGRDKKKYPPVADLAKNLNACFPTGTIVKKG